ncbi:Pfs, NACHT and ankyrin domain protein [Mycena floridula]|nr:Pfs, NACHT and ankyrin domain protein [Mycena floridula]
MNPHTSCLESLNKIVSYTTKLDFSGVRERAFFGSLKSLQTIIRFMGAQICDDNILQALASKLGHIAINLNIEHLEWPFSAEDEGEILAAISHIESLLDSGQPLASVPLMTEDVDQAGPPDARLNNHPHGSSMINAQNIHAGIVSGDMFSHNTINQADPAVRRKVDNLMKRAIDAETIKKQKDFLNWISKLDFQATQRQTFEKHAVQTGEWFLKRQEFVDWKDGKTKVLWCPGIPGAGKTILSSITINHLQSIADPTMAVLYIYCDYTRHGDQTPTQLLGALLKQLVQHRQSISDHLLTLHATCLSQEADPTITELITALHTETSLYSHVHIIVDALDECSENDQARELFFSTHPQGLWTLPDNVHILITSRDILSISQEFHSTPRISIKAHNEDLQTYIKGRIITDVKLKRLVKGDITLETEIIDEVILKAAGMFLQAQLHLDALASQLNRRSLRTALNSLPEGIMNSYDAAMARIKAQGEAEYELACRIFYWLAYAEQPLSTKELQHAVAVSDDMSEMDFEAIVDIDMLTGICAGLIVIREEAAWLFNSLSKDDKIIQLVHYTTQEYFQLKQQLLFLDIHSSMAITCLTYMGFDTFDTTHVTYAMWLLYPLAQYAIGHWGKHAKKDEATTMPYIFKFLEKENNIAHIFNQSRDSNVWKWPTTGQAHILAWLGLDQTLKSLISKDHSAATSIDKNGSTPLSYAARQGHIDIVKLLLEKNADPAAADQYKCTPLSHAARRGHIDIVKLLLEKNADPAAADQYKRTPLSYAARWGHIDIVKLLLEKNADPAAADEYQGPLFLEKNADPAAADQYQRTPLSYAAEEGHIDIVKLLLEKNADPAAADEYKRTPLSYAARQGHIDIVKLLLEKNADPAAADEYKRTPLSYAARRGHIDIVKLLLEKNADPAAADQYKRTPLSYAARRGHIDIVKLLLEKNADPAAADQYKRTPLSYAARRGHIDIVKLLLEKNADPAAADEYQRTPLSHAARWGHIDIVKLFLEKNADPAAADQDQRTPLSHAAEGGHIGIVKLLLEKNADPAAADQDQRTLLSYAAEEGHIDIVKLLLEKNADPAAADQDQRTPLSYAAEEGHIDIVKLLEKNADPAAADQYTTVLCSSRGSH